VIVHSVGDHRDQMHEESLWAGFSSKFVEELVGIVEQLSGKQQSLCLIQMAYLQIRCVQYQMGVKQLSDQKISNLLILL